MAFVELDDVSKVFADARGGTGLLTLDHVSLSLEKYELLCVLGPSGCGKSTLLNMIAGFEHPTSGTVRVDGKPVTAPGADRSVVFQQATLLPWLPVWENVAFYHKLQGRSKKERQELAQPYIDLVGLTGFEHHYPAELSGGMSQRVGIARALLLDSSVILMDEPFAALDAQTKSEIHEELVTIWQKSRATIFFVAHSIEEALLLGTKVAVMSHRPGRICELIPVDLPRPRDTTSPQFNDLKRYVLALVRAQGAAAGRPAQRAA
ncbi:NitT/TauT family transport system ATP-binding protein [Paraburkholderia sp. WC7.3g]|uniref:ABC transporter ATP-binding protein n=1 Tax=Paraburkholderia sp. WC7.3g TaxID=2991070 RepID=UPI003D1E1991